MNATADKLRGVSAADGSTKARLERAALTLFAASGIDGVSTKEIALKAGLSEGAIYRHFKSKDELARGLMKAIHIRLTEMIQVAGERDQGLGDQIDFIVRHYCQIADDDWDLFTYHCLYLHYFSKLSETRAESPLSAAATLIERAISKGEIDPAEPYILAAMALGTVQQTAQAKVFGYIDGPLTAHTHLFKKAVFGVLGYEERT